MIRNRRETIRPPIINVETFLKKLYSVLSDSAHHDSAEIRIRVKRASKFDHRVELIYGGASLFLVNGFAAGFFDGLLNQSWEKDLIEDSDATDS